MAHDVHDLYMDLYGERMEWLDTGNSAMCWKKQHDHPHGSVMHIFADVGCNLQNP